MATIVELAPVLAEGNNPQFPLVHGIWNSSEQAEQLAAARGHTYRRPEGGGVTERHLHEALDEADALIVAPTVATATGMWQPLDGNEAGRLIGHRVLDVVSARRPDLHVVLVSHFLVGHGRAHKNAKPSTSSLQALEAHVRAGTNSWTVLRPTWLSTIHDEWYRTRLTNDLHADGLVSRDGLADAVITAIENPESAVGRSAAVFNLSIPLQGTSDLVSDFRALPQDWEAVLARESVPA